MSQSDRDATGQPRAPKAGEERADAWGPMTAWTMIADAAEAEDPARREKAWMGLIERYRSAVKASVFAHCRYTPNRDEIAEDFFAYLYEGSILRKADRDQGRFRQFIQGVIRRYVQHARRSTPHGAIGGEQDGSQPEPVAISGRDEAEKMEEHAWASGLLANAVGRLTESGPGSRNGELLLRSMGIEPFELTSRQALREEYGMTEGALNEAIASARRRLRTILGNEIRETVGSDQDFEEEQALLVARLLEAHPGLEG